MYWQGPFWRATTRLRSWTLTSWFQYFNLTFRLGLLTHTSWGINQTFLTSTVCFILNFSLEGFQWTRHTGVLSNVQLIVEAFVLLSLLFKLKIRCEYRFLAEPVAWALTATTIKPWGVTCFSLIFWTHIWEFLWSIRYTPGLLFPTNSHSFFVCKKAAWPHCCSKIL